MLFLAFDSDVGEPWVFELDWSGSVLGSILLESMFTMGFGDRRSGNIGFEEDVIGENKAKGSPRSEVVGETGGEEV